jgi:hypothetical protein
MASEMFALFGLPCCCSVEKKTEEAVTAAGSPSKPRPPDPATLSVTGENPEERPSPMRKPNAGSITQSTTGNGTHASGSYSPRADDDRIETMSQHSVKSAGAYSATSSVGTEFMQAVLPAKQRESMNVQKIMKNFVKAMLKGREIHVLAVDGQLRLCTCCLDRKLKHMSIEMNGLERKVVLGEVDEVCQGQEPQDIDTPLDDMCCTLLLKSGECITFQFDKIEERENFAMCFQILVDGLH